MTRIGLVAALLLLAAAPAAAHRGHASLSVVEIDAASGAVTVTHRLAAHDVEPALSRIAPDAQASVDDPDALAAFVAYAGRAFRLVGEDGTPAPLEHVRTELAGDSITVVYRTRLAAPAKTVTVDSNLLEETWPDQENQVNVRRSKVTRTVVFRPGDAAQEVTFD